LFYIPKFRIQKISIQGNSTLHKEEIISNVSRSLEGRYWGIFPRDNIFIFPKEKISNNLSNTFPRVKSVILKSDFPNSLLVEIDEKKPSAIFCEGEFCGFIDEDGAIFETAAFFSDNVYVKFYSEIGRMENLNNFKRMMDFIALLSKENIEITSVILGEEGLLKFFTSERWSILLNDNDNFQIALENLKLALGEQIKEKRQALEYIDLRFGNKIYYKFK